MDRPQAGRDPRGRGVRPYRVGGALRRRRGAQAHRRDQPAARPGAEAARGPHCRDRDQLRTAASSSLAPDRAVQGRHGEAARPDRGAGARARRGAEAPARPLRRPRLAAAAHRDRAGRGARRCGRRADGSRERCSSAGRYGVAWWRGPRRADPREPRDASARDRRGRRHAPPAPMRRPSSASTMARSSCSSAATITGPSQDSRVRARLPEERARPVRAVLDRQRAFRAAATTARRSTRSAR